jgi:hypothetical protein
MRDRPVAEACIGTTHNIHNKQISMLSAGFEPAIPASDPRQLGSALLIIYCDNITEESVRIERPRRKHAD